MSICRVAYAQLSVEDVNDSVGVHTDILGMQELGRDGDDVLLGFGVDNGVDLLLSESESGSGVRRFALRVDEDSDLDFYGKRLRDAGVQHCLATDAIKGVRRCLSFTTPSGHKMELVDTDEPTYVHPSRGRPRSGIRALDFDHITLQARDPKPLMDFLIDILDFKLSDVFAPAPGVIGAAWLRAGDFHHDIAIVSTPEPDKSLHHYALTMESFDHLKTAADTLAAHGQYIEVGPGRHGVGGNVYTYFWVTGNRYELSGEMPRVSRGEPNVWDNFPETFSLWGLQPPESFSQSS